MIPITVRVGGTSYRSLGERSGGILYLSGLDLYGHLPDADAYQFPAAGDKPDTEFLLDADNGVWRTEAPLVYCTAGAPCASRVGGRSVAFGPAAVLADARVLIPVVPGLPFIRTTVHGDTVTVTPDGWPAGQLPATPTGASVVLWGPGAFCLPPDQITPARVGPGSAVELGVCFRDAEGLGITPDHRPDVTFSLSAPGPLRLAAPMPPTVDPRHPPTATTLTVMPTTPLGEPFPTAQVYAPGTRGVSTGRYELNVGVQGYAPVTWPVLLTDDRPYTLAVSLASAPTVGQPATLLVTLHKRDGSLYDPGPGTGGRQCVLSATVAVLDTPRVEVAGPDGEHPATLTPAVCSSLPEGATAMGPAAFFQGAAHYRFVPDQAGAYRVSVTWPEFQLGGQAWSLSPAALAFTVPPTH